MVTILYFASVKERLGLPRETLALPEGVASVAALREWLGARGGEWREVLAAANLKFAVNRAMVTPDASVRDGDEVAIFPPVTGG